MLHRSTIQKHDLLGWKNAFFKSKYEKNGSWDFLVQSNVFKEKATNAEKPSRQWFVKKDF